ncbi:COG1361 S-layer family protein [Methanospirillum stamsii]|uniref:S-layer protein n=1 Tax=Methanospirillum stamsii TaxID=1277351 RepID=A0A2V2N6L7_9EURY|nr:COG1361 S-layer family protein [Methanospirillum stamsii]PWR75479.1 S-layer protein [Methanospirillum stamsii]
MKQSFIYSSLSGNSGKMKTNNNGKPELSVSGKLLLILASLLVMSAFITTPVLAGTKYMTGSPELSVSIDGNNEFTPGTTVPLTILVQNSGLNQIKFVQSGIVDSDDVPNTAKMVTVTLLPGESPILVKSDPQMAGDITGSEVKPVCFEIRIPEEANAGTYALPVVLDYTYLGNSEQEGTDSIVYRYVSKKLEMELPFIIKSAINLNVTDVQAENINSGGSGFITLTLKNTGTDSGKNAIANISRIGNSPLIPVSNSVFIGEFAPGSEKTLKYKVSVAKDAEPQDYPLGISVTYENADGETITTTPQKVGVFVGADVEFTITSEKPQMNPGKKNFIEVTYRNDGSVPVYGAEVRISAVDPFTSADDLSYLGDIQPGESAVARFGLSVDETADTKIYGLDSEIKYRDALNDSHVSDTIKVPIDVVPKEGLAALLSSPVFVGLLIVIILGGGYYLYEHRRKNSKQ